MITIIDYGVGNIGSVSNTLDRLGARYLLSADPREVAGAETLLLPGVGAAGTGMRNLKDRGLDAAIRKAVNLGTPVIGICLGLQLLFEFSEEGGTECLGILKGRVKKFGGQQRIPQIGWNTVKPSLTNPMSRQLFNGIPDASTFYFVNSYYPVPADAGISCGLTEYGETFTSMIAAPRIIATQFHPEKSGNAGFTLLQNILKEYI